MTATVKKRKKLNKKVIIFILIILVVLALGIGGYLLLSSDNKDNKKPNIIDKIKTTEAKDKNYSFKTTIDELEIYYLALSGKKTLDITFNTDDTYDNTIIWNVEDNEIISVDENNCIHGNKVGTTTLTGKLKNGFTKTYKIMVTDLIVPAKVNHSKKALPCGRYTKEEADLLDKILASRVQEGGKGSRGGVVAAARFLTLEFPYVIKYFNQSGSTYSGSGQAFVDGEGRWYHEGLYLHESKYETLAKKSNGQPATMTGPAIWGCNLRDTFVNKIKANGLTCSGFVSWAMLNGGYAYGDYQAGHPGQSNTYYAIGPHHEITKEYIDGGTYKPGDYIARAGHAALIIGVDDTTIYVAEELPRQSSGYSSSGNMDLNVYLYGKGANTTPLPGHNKKGILVDGNLTFVVEMSDIYPNGDGNYTMMWEE